MGKEEKINRSELEGKKGFCFEGEGEDSQES